MDVAKENASAITDRNGLKNNLATFSTAKKLTALSDVRNTVHKKNLDHSSMGKLLQLDTERTLETPKPRRAQTPLVERLEDVDAVQKDAEDNTLLWHCRCDFDAKDYISAAHEDDFLPDEIAFTEVDMDNLCKVWFGQGGRDGGDAYVFKPVEVTELDRTFFDTLHPFEIPSNDSDIESDFDLRMDELMKDFEQTALW